MTRYADFHRRSVDAPEATSFPISGFTYGSFTKRSVQFG